jgi:hypothetical protein
MELTPSGSRKLKAVWSSDARQDMMYMRLLSRTPKAAWLYDMISGALRWMWRRTSKQCYNCYCNWTARSWLAKWPHYYPQHDKYALELAKGIADDVDRRIMEEILKDYTK